MAKKSKAKKRKVNHELRHILKQAWNEAEPTEAKRQKQALKDAELLSVVARHQIDRCGGLVGLLKATREAYHTELRIRSA